MTSLPKNASSIDLSGSWQLASADGEITSAMTLPGDVHTALHAAERHSGPLFRPQRRAGAVGRAQDWVIERSFSLPDDRRRLVSRYRLSRHRRIGLRQRLAGARGRQLLPPLPAGCLKRAEGRRQHDPHRAAFEHCRRCRTPEQAAVLHSLSSPAIHRSPTATCCASRNAISAGTGTSRSRRSASTARSR